MKNNIAVFLIMSLLTGCALGYYQRMYEYECTILDKRIDHLVYTDVVFARDSEEAESLVRRSYLYKYYYSEPVECFRTSGPFFERK